MWEARCQQFNWSYDIVPPTMTITSSEVDDGDTSNHTTLSLTFTASEATSDFVVNDITVSGGALSDFAATSSTEYTATFTPSGSGTTTIDVPGGVFTDASGNNNTAATQFNWSYDIVPPTMTITSSEVDDGDTSNHTTLSLTFTASEATSDFVVNDITVSGGALSDFAATSSTEYTATFTPSGSGTTTIDVPGGVFTDASGNNNTAATQFNWSYDIVPPTMTITSSEVDDGDTSNHTTLSLTFTASEATSDFVVNDITVSGGALSDFAATSSTEYTATFTPSGSGTTTIDVPGGVFTDASGNNNTAATQFNWSYDIVPPTMTITSSEVDDGDTSNHTTLSLTFTASEATSDFVVNDITVSGGALSDFAATSSTEYTATFTPSGSGTTTIDVPGGVFTDASGNNNTAATQFNWSYDIVPPTMTITSSEVDDGDTSNHTTLSLTFTASEATSDFVVNDITVSGGALSDFAATSSTEYTATFTPSGSGTTTIDVPGGVFTDASGNNNTAATQFNWSYDIVPPTMTITSSEVDDGDTSNHTTLSLTFTASEATSDFVVNDITVSGGALSDFAATSSTEYTATFTPSGSGTTTIDVPGGVFTDASGNNNTAATQFNWSYDIVPPTMTITSSEVDDGDTSNHTTLSLTFTASEATSDFVVNDITVSGGALSDFAATSSTEYTATFTPSGSGTTTIDVPGGVFTDASGNNNTAATQFNWSYDIVPPTMTITSSEVDDGDTSNHTTLSLTFTASEATSDFVVNDITVSGGALSDFAATSSTEYTATFTPSGSGTTTIDVPGGVFTDASGNNNTAATQFNWSYDIVPPTMTITSSEVDDGDTSNHTTLSLTFTASEATSDFVVNDITVSGGALSDFAATSSTEYTATFTPSGSGTTTIDVPGGVFTDASGNNNTAATQFNWSYDIVPPTMTITSSEVDDGDTSNHTTLSLTFTASEATSDFVVNDITVSGGALSDFAATSSTEYTATFTPSGSGTTTIDVPGGVFTDASGNNNTAATQFNWSYDIVPPTMTITSSEVDDGDTSNHTTLSLTFTASEATSDFVVNDITVSGGALSDFAATSSTEYTATFTPSGSGTTTIDVPGGVFTDASGNNNTAATTTN